MKKINREDVENIVEWFAVNKRDLPWRANNNPYAVWISEIMLQQTRIEAVIPKYLAFMHELPNIESLAGCDDDKLMKLWEGLGYYSRARNIKKCALVLKDKYYYKFPQTKKELITLPGIGPYTAGAIASIAYGKVASAVDGNVLRVISRVTLSREDILKQSVKRSMEQAIVEIMPADRPGAFNQALMELGAMVCVPNGEPHCESCPLKGLCLARKMGAMDEIPVKKAKKPRRIEEKTVMIIRDGEHLAIHKRPPKGLLSGLYELPNTEGHLTQDEAVAWVKEKGFSPIRIKGLETAKHIFSHVEWHMTAYLILIEDPQETGEYLFVEPEKTEEKYPIPAAFAAYARYMEIKLGQEKYREEL